MQIRGSQKVVKILFDFSAVFPFSSYRCAYTCRIIFSSTYPILIFLFGLVWRYRDKYNLSDQDAMRLLNTIRDPGDLKELKSKLEGLKGPEAAEILKELESPAYRAGFLLQLCE